MRKQRHQTPDAYNCPVEAALDLLGGKWKGVILYRLGQRTMRFNELCRVLCKLSARVLTKQLRELEADGLVHREVFAEVPPRVEYSLTAKGEAALPIIQSLSMWGMEHVLHGKPTAAMIENGDVAAMNQGALGNASS